MGGSEKDAQRLEERVQLAERVRAAQKGDAGAFEDLVLEHRALLYRVALVRLRNATDAMDALDEAIAKGWMKIRTLRDPALFPAWLTRILVNASNDRLRRRKRVVSLEEQGDFAAAPAPGEEMLDLRDAVRQLPDPLYAMIVLKYYDDLTIEQAAQRLGLPLGTAKSHLHRALQRLRIIMGEDAV